VKTVTDRLWAALQELAKMRHPSVAQILRRRGFGYEADRMDELVTAFDEIAHVQEESDGGDSSPQPAE
jgi:DNA phosphorothioation-dependent restriction protein DptG